MNEFTVTVIGREGCHLCDDATAIIEEVLRDFPSGTLVHKSLDDHPELEAPYSDKIPVVLIDGKEYAHWRVHPDRLRKTLLDLASATR